MLVQQQVPAAVQREREGRGGRLWWLCWQRTSCAAFRGTFLLPITSEHLQVCKIGDRTAALKRARAPIASCPLPLEAALPAWLIAEQQGSQRRMAVDETGRKRRRGWDCKLRHKALVYTEEVHRVVAAQLQSQAGHDTKAPPSPDP